MNMAISYIPIEPLPNIAPAVSQTVALPISPAPQPSAFPADSAPPPAYSEDSPSPMPLDIFWRLRHHRITITCCICLYLLFAYRVYVYFGEAHHGIDTFMAWCILFWVRFFSPPSNLNFLKFPTDWSRHVSFCRSSGTSKYPR